MFKGNTLKLKTVGILLSYLTVVFGFYFWDWSPLGFFAALYLELVVIVITYVVLRILDKSHNPKKYRKLPDISNIIVALIGALLLQYVFLHVTLTIFNSAGTWDPLELMNRSGGWITLFIIALAYIIDSSDQRTISQKEFDLQQNLFLEILALSGMNVLGFVFINALESIEPSLILLIMFTGRSAIEFYFIRKTEQKKPL